MSGYYAYSTVAVTDPSDVKVQRHHDELSVFIGDKPGAQSILWLSIEAAATLRDQLDDLLSEGPDDGTDAAVDRIRAN